MSGASSGRLALLRNRPERANSGGEEFVRRGLDRGNKSTADGCPDEAGIAIFPMVSTKAVPARFESAGFPKG